MPPCATEAALGILADPMRNVNSFFQKKKNSLLKSAGGCAIIYKLSKSGGLAQLVRASASHAEGRRFESAALHQKKRSRPKGGALSFGDSSRADSKGAVLENMPVAGFPRDPARPQAGESAASHQRRKLFCLPRQESFSSLYCRD